MRTSANDLTAPLDDLTFRLARLPDGRPGVLWSNGRHLPIVSGGSDAGGAGGGGDGGGDGGVGDGGGGDGGDGGDGGGSDDGGAGDAGGGSDDGGAGGRKGAESVTMTRAELDAMVARAKRGAKNATTAEIRAYLEQQNMTESDRIKAESLAKDEQIAAANRTVATTKIETRAERLALAADCKPDRVAKLLRLLDLSDVDALTDDDGNPDDAAIAALVKAELEAMPELKGKGGPATGGGASGGEFNGGTDEHVFTRAEIDKMTTAEFAKHEAAIDDQTKRGLIK